MLLLNKEFYIGNRQKLLDRMKEDSLAVFFSGRSLHRSADDFYPFLVNRNFYYLTGLEEENITLVMMKKGGKVEECCFIDRPDPLLEKWVDKKYTQEEAREISGIQDMDWSDGFEDALTKILNGYSFENIYLDLELASWNGQAQKGSEFAQEILKRFPYLNIQNAYPILRDLRTIKEPGEVQRIKKAIEITHLGIQRLMEVLKPGMKEYQAEAYFDFEIKHAGARDHAFETIAASGVNATILHYVGKQDTIGEDELVLFDLGADYKHYCADITRTLPASGKFTPRQRTLYDIVLKAGEEVIRAMKPGLHFSDLNNIAKRTLTQGCMEIGLIQKEEEISKYYYHGVSHYLGLDTHDVGDRDRVLEAGMVFTVEPGLYVKEEGIGIRIEDNVLITEEGCEVLSKEIPKKAEEIEAFMAKFKG